MISRLKVHKSEGLEAVTLKVSTDDSEAALPPRHQPGEWASHPQPRSSSNLLLHAPHLGAEQPQDADLGLA